jgi:CheY-like chemotaxis protein
MTTPSEILVVDDDVPSLAGLLSLLRNLGYRTTGAANVEGGYAMLDAFPFDVLITDIRLHGESGVKLIQHAQLVQPAIAIIAITGFPDAVVEQDVINLGAIFMRKPLDVRSLRDILAERVASGRRQRRWNRKRVAGGGFGAHVAGHSAKIVDVSYGGFRLEMSSPPDPSQSPTINMDLLPFGFTVNADLVWVSRHEPTGSWNCGAALSHLDPTIERAWRVVVDALPESSH